MLILDFDFVEKGVAAGLPERESWRAAFALTVSLVWIYTNLLRLLAIFSSGLTPPHDRRPGRPAWGARAVVMSARPGSSALAPRPLRGLALGPRPAAAVPQLDPEPAYAAPGAADLGAVELGARGPRGLDGRPGDRQHALAAEGLADPLLAGQSDRGQRRRQQHGDQRA